MGLSSPKNLLKSLQTELPRGEPIDIHTLNSMGISTALAWKYAKNGWLTHLARGVFMFQNDQLAQDECLKFLARRIPGLHVGSKTALAWRGVTHNLSSRENLCLWGDAPAKLPEWFASRFPARYQSRHLFSGDLPSGYGLAPVPEKPGGPLVSVPERALLELLSDVGTSQGVEETRNLMEAVRSVREEVLVNLLRNCLRVKVARLCVHWSEELGLPWAKTVRDTVRAKFGNARWSLRLPEGSTLILKP